MRRTSFIIAFSIVVACAPTGNMSILRGIEDYIQEKPALALEELSVIDKNVLNGGKERALYALLYSMALDKNYFDIDTDTLIAPAVHFYPKTTDRFHKFLTYYYRARISENAHKPSEALNYYLLAEQNVSDDTPAEYLARLYSRKSRTYTDMCSYEQAIEETMKAKAVSAGLDNPLFYLRNSLDAAMLFYETKQPKESAEELQHLLSWIDSKGLEVPSDYYRTELLLMIFHILEAPEKVSKEFSKYCMACDMENRLPSPVLCSDVSLYLGDHDAAEEYFRLARLEDGCSLADSISYYYTAANIDNIKQDFGNYVIHHALLDSLTEALSIDITKRDIRFIEEKFEYEKNKSEEVRRKKILIVVICCLCAAILASIVFYSKRKREYERALEEARADYEFIKKMVDRAQNSDSKIKEFFSTRLTALIPFFQQPQARRFKRNDFLQLRLDNIEMLRNIGFFYAITYPEFVSDIAGCGLSSEEVGLCALYASGFASKELGDLLSSGSIYHINRNLRDRLQPILNGQNLPSGLRKHFEKCNNSSKTEPPEHQIGAPAAEIEGN